MTTATIQPDLQRPQLVLGNKHIGDVTEIVSGIVEKKTTPLWWKIAVGMLISGIVYVAAIFALRVVTIKEIRGLKDQVLQKGK